MPLGMEIGLGLSAQATLCSMGTQLPPEKGHTHPHPICGPCVLWPNGWMNQDATWHRGKHRLWRRCVRWGRSSPKRGTAPLPQFSVHGYCRQTAGWMKTPLGTDVDLSQGHMLLDGVSALRERDTAAPLFSAYVYCGQGSPSQLLLISCLKL